MTQTLKTDPVKLALSLFDALAAGDLGPWSARLAPEFTFAYPGMPSGKGKQAAEAYNAPFAAAFSDWKTEVHRSAVSGDTVFIEMTVQATHSAPLVTPDGTLPASGRRGAVKAVLVSKQKGDRILYEATYWNVPDLVAQIAAED
jgi:ketosteroid isomerase-like protein